MLQNQSTEESLQKRDVPDLNSAGLPWEFPWENPQIPIWDGDGNYFKAMGIPTCGNLWDFLWDSVGFPVSFCGISYGILWDFL